MRLSFTAKVNAGLAGALVVLVVVTALAYYGNQRGAEDGRRLALAMGGVAAIVLGLGAVIVINHDLRARQRAEQALGDSEEKYRVLFESSRDAIMTTAPPEWRFTSGNPATIAMFRAKNEAEFVARHPWELSPEVQPDGRASDEKAREMIAQALRGGSHFFEWTHRRLTGEEFPATVLLTRFELKGQTLLQATVRDITEQHAVEAQVRLAQKMDSIGRLTGGVVHDFKNLLTVINGLAELWLSEAEPDARGRSDIQEIREVGMRAAELTRQLLMFGRRQSGQPVVFDANASITQMDRFLRRLVREDVALMTRLTPGEAPVRMDPGQFEQVLVNLVINFEPFFSTKAAGEGTGLGLATVYGVVTQAGGHIDVQSQPGRTTFTIDLPWAGTGEAAQPGSDTAPPAVRSLTDRAILVVDDNAGIRTLVSRTLARKGGQVLEASDGVEALARLAQAERPVDLVLTDLTMPAMGGRSLVNEVRRLYPRVKILTMSAYPWTANEEDPGPALPFLQKPFTRDALETAILEALSRPAD